MKRIAITTWSGSVGSTLDFASTLLLVDTHNGKNVGAREISLKSAQPQAMALRYEELGVDVVICGAISRCLAHNLAMRRIRVIPFVSGDTEQVVKAFLEGKLDDRSFLMVGFRPGTRKAWRCRHGQGRPRRA